MVCIRADGNSEIGSGHVMRCLSLAEALRAGGKDVVFITAGPEMKDMITARGYKVHVLNSDHRDLEAEIEIYKTLDLFKETEGVIVDSYFVTDEYFECLKELAKTVYITDHFDKYPVDILINYNIYAAEEKYKELYGDPCPDLIMGPGYAPLRSEFAGVTGKPIKVTAENVLLLTGGADPEHVSLKFAKEIVKRKDNLKYSLVVGGLSRDYDEILKIAGKDERIEVLRNVKDMRSLMEKADIAVSAAGSTLYELCACHVPVINYILADNQISAAKTFNDRNIMIFGGDARSDEDFAAHIIDHVFSLSKDVKKRREMSEAGDLVTDGMGAKRLAEKLISLF